MNNLKTKLEGGEASLEVFYADAQNLIKLYIRKAECPAELLFIAEEIAIQRFRRVGSEAVSQESVDVVSATYNSMSALDDYKDILDHYNAQNSGRLRVL